MKSNTLPTQLIKPISSEDSYIQQVFNYYQQCYERNENMQAFVEHSSRIPDDLRGVKQIGLCNRTLGKKIPPIRTLDGGAMRGSLKRSGLLLASGHELFRGCVIFLAVDSHDRVISAVGYRYGNRIRHWQQEVIHWDKQSENTHIEQGYKLIQEVIHE